MRRLNNMRIGGRLALSFTLVLAFMIAVIVVGLISLQKVQNELEVIVKYENLRTQQANIMTDLARETAIAVRDYLLGNYSQESPEQLQTYLVTLDEKRQAYDHASARLDDLVPPDDELGAALIKSVRTSANISRLEQDSVIHLVGTGDVKGATHTMMTWAYPSVLKWISALDDQIKYEDERTLTRYAEAEALYIRTRTFIIGLGAAAVLFSLLIAILLTVGIANPLTKITRIAEAIGDGDLTVSLPDDRRLDEVGKLTEAFRRMVATLRDSTADMSSTVGLLGSSASEILASTSQVVASTADAAVSISETTTTVEEVRQAAQLSAEKAKTVSDNAQRVAQVSQNGQRAVTETSAGMDLIRAQMEIIAQTVVRLSEQSQSIGGIIASVTDLADQSNLLAVNAAIEAAKAGEQGRGFAVVAQEIKSLAEQSKQATTQVRGILSHVQRATGNAVMATEQGSKAVEAGVKQAGQAGEAIRLLAESSDEAVQAAIQIVASSQQQVVGMQQIGVAMVNINQAGAQTAVSMKQMEGSAQDLQQLGEQLETLVKQFKV